jgi:hypothetical protein
MTKFIFLTVQYTTEKTREELINVGHVYRVIDSPNGKGATLYFGVSGPEIKVTETVKDVYNKIGSV